MDDRDKRLQVAYGKNPQDWTDGELRLVREMTDDELVRFSGSKDFVPQIESTRRLREAVRAEERATKWLTWVLVALTTALLGLAAVEYWRHQ